MIEPIKMYGLIDEAANTSLTTKSFEQALIVLNGFQDYQAVIKAVNSQFLLKSWLLKGSERVFDSLNEASSKRPPTPFEKYLSSINLPPYVEMLVVDEGGNPVSIESIKIKQLELRVSELEKPKKKKGKKQ